MPCWHSPMCDRNLKKLIRLFGQTHYSQLGTPSTWSPLLPGYPATWSPHLPGYPATWSPHLPGYPATWSPLLPGYPATWSPLLPGYPATWSPLLPGTWSYPVPDIAHDLVPGMTQLFYRYLYLTGCTRYPSPRQVMVPDSGLISSIFSYQSATAAPSLSC